MAYVISISNGKGGVAKTTTSISLGASLAKMGRHTLLIDLDHNANLTLGFGTLPNHITTYSKDLFTELRDQPLKCLNTGYKNLEIIPSDGNMNFLEARTLSIHNTVTVLRRAIKSALPQSYDFIVIDCPASLGYLTINALTASDLLIIPTQAEFFSAYALQTMFSLIRDIRLKKNPELKYRILVTMLDLRLRDHLNILIQLKKHLKDSLYKTMILEDTQFRASHSQGVPINYATPTTRGAIQYRELAQEIINDLPKKSVDNPEQLNVSESVHMNNVVTNQINQTVINPTNNNAQLSNQNTPMLVSPIKFPQKKQQDKKGMFCSYLGRDEDPQTMLAYPSTWNKCYRAKPAVSPSLDHQNTCCISSNYLVCPMLKDKTKSRLPSNLRSPIYKSELLHYFKNWILDIGKTP